VKPILIKTNHEIDAIVNVLMQVLKRYYNVLFGIGIFTILGKICEEKRKPFLILKAEQLSAGSFYMFSQTLKENLEDCKQHLAPSKINTIFHMVSLVRIILNGKKIVQEQGLKSFQNWLTNVQN